MLYVQQIGSRQYTVRDTGASFSIFANGVRTGNFFNSLKEGVDFIQSIAKEREQNKLILRICLPLIGLGIAILWRLNI